MSSFTVEWHTILVPHGEALHSFSSSASLSYTGHPVCDAKNVSAISICDNFSSSSFPYMVQLNVLMFFSLILCWTLFPSRSRLIISAHC